MSPCRNCGNINSADAIFCRSCGTKLGTGAPVSQPSAAPEFSMPEPRPYAWQTDEFTAKNQARGTMPIIDNSPQGASIQHAAPQFVAPFRCPSCGTQLTPRVERKISTAGWVTFAILLVTVFPLFWIGLLIREDVPVCQVCQAKLTLGPYR